MSSEAEYKDCFDLFDMQNTGQISAASAGEALRTLGKAPSQADLKLQELLTGKSGVDFASFKALASKLDCPSKEEVTEAFSVFDIQGNGYIPLKELTHVLKSLGEGLEDDILAKLAEITQPDADSQVNFRHFVDVMMNDL